MAGNPNTSDAVTSSTPEQVTVKAAEPSQSERHQHEPMSQRPIDPGHPDHPMNQ